MRRSVLPALISLLAGSCSVDRKVLDERDFPCRSDADCIDAYGCQLVTPAGDGFCAPRVDAARDCDGFRTVDGLCLPQCVPDEPSSCEPERECFSSDVVGAEVGYCVPETLCSSDDDCGDAEACLSTAIRNIIGYVYGQYEIEDVGLSCIPTCEQGNEDDCPTGTECFIGYCMPRCGDDSECPLGFGCSSGAGSSIGLCIPGVPWLLTPVKCRDASSCLVGSCTSYTVPGTTDDTISYCIAPCDGSVTDPACSRERVVDGRLNVYTCGHIPPYEDQVLPEVGEQCVFVGGYMGFCDPGRFSDDCASGLDCREVYDSVTQRTYNLCVKDCTYDAGAPNLDRLGDCTDDAFCYPVDESDAGVCLYDLPVDAVCQFDEHCGSGVCDREASCEQPAEDLGCCAP